MKSTENSWQRDLCCQSLRYRFVIDRRFHSLVADTSSAGFVACLAVSLSGIPTTARSRPSLTRRRGRPRFDELLSAMSQRATTARQGKRKAGRKRRTVSINRVSCRELHRAENRSRTKTRTTTSYLFFDGWDGGPAGTSDGICRCSKMTISSSPRLAVRSATSMTPVDEA